MDKVGEDNDVTLLLVLVNLRASNCGKTDRASVRLHEWA